MIQITKRTNIMKITPPTVLTTRIVSPTTTMKTVATSGTTTRVTTQRYHPT